VDLSAPRIDRIAMAREIQSGSASDAQQRAGSLAGAALRLDALQGDTLVASLGAFAAAARDPEARAAWQDLAAAVAELEVPPPLLERLGVVVEAALASGQARREGGAGAELALRALARCCGLCRGAQRGAGRARRRAPERGQRFIAGPGRLRPYA
jgi:hypothetical protein